MMNTVTTLKATCSRENIVRLFARFSDRYGASWATRLGANPDWEACIDGWLEDLMCFDYQSIVLATKSCFVLYKDFPPTFGQFEDLCKKHSGFLQCDEALSKVVKKDFSHPIVKIMYDNIGSWALSHDSEKEIKEKAEKAYKMAEIEFSLYPKECWEKLEQFKAKPKEIPAPPKIPSEKERWGFKEHMTEYQKKLEEAKIVAEGKTHREFDEKLITPSNRNFDQKVYEEYRKYLLSIPENETLTFPPKYIYARSRFILQNEVPEHLRRAGYVTESDRINKNDQNFDKPNKNYKNWNYD